MDKYTMHTIGMHTRFSTRLKMSDSEMASNVSHSIELATYKLSQ